MNLKKYNGYLEQESCSKCKRDLNPSRSPALAWIHKKTKLCNICSKEKNVVKRIE